MPTTTPSDDKARFPRYPNQPATPGLPRPLPIERLPIRRISWLRAIAAAVILLIAGTVFLYKCNNTHSRSPKRAGQSLQSSNKI